MTAAQPPPQVDIPPSIGGTGLAAIAGVMGGRVGGAVLLHGQTATLLDWLIPLGALAFVGVLLGSMLLARRKMGAVPSPESVRRQWIVVGVGLLTGVLLGLISVW